MNSLEIYANDHQPGYLKCDGCGKDIEVGEKVLNGIDSCCGGCCRCLCFACVVVAARLVTEERDERDH